MKNLPSLLNRAVLAVAGALALGACSRGQYAVLPKAPAYLGSAPIAATAPRPATQPAAVVAPAAPVAPAATVPARPVAAAPAARPAAKLVATPAPVVEAAPAPTAAYAPEAAAAPAKPGLVQRLAMKKLTNKLDKLASQAPQLKQRDAAAGTNRIDGKLRYAIIFGVVSIIFFAIGGTLGNLIGTILLVIGLLFLLFWLLDNL